VNRTDFAARIEARLQRAWQTRGLIAHMMLPLSGLFALGRALDMLAFRLGIRRTIRIDRPVIVVGNLYVGGTGKTPLTLALAKLLAERGYRLGVVMRGYRGSATGARIVEAGSHPREVGDEPLLLAQALQGRGITVVVGRDRVAACHVLLSARPNCNLIITDDGLQHRRLARDVEIAVVDERGIGNGWLLPAGPLRDPPERLRTVSAVVCNGAAPAFRIYSPRFEMTGKPGRISSLADPTRATTIEALVLEQQRGSLRVLAAAGIGVPQRFFSMLRTHGLAIEELPLPDHFDFSDNPFKGRTFDIALITAKDAVKCGGLPSLATDGRICVVELQTAVDTRLADLIEDHIRSYRIRERRSEDGSETA
jgi:tetraacyldisaccharide 4'-kinase